MSNRPKGAARRTSQLWRELTTADIDDFLAGYPGQQGDASTSANMEFYKNERKMQPDGLTYEDWMEKKENDFEELEANQCVAKQGKEGKG